jgi:hypothetical protein
MEAGDLAQLRVATEVEHEKALAAGDLTEELKTCRLAISFDPDLADRWLSTLREKVHNTDDLGIAIAYMVAELQERQPARLHDLGARWIEALPQITTSGPIEYYQMLVCELWGKLDIFRPRVIEILKHFTVTVPEEIESLWSEARLFEEEVQRGTATKTDDSPDENEAWKMLARFIRIVGQIEINDNESNQAALKFVSAIIGSWKRIAVGLPAWERNNISTTILSSIAGDEEGSSIKPGPIAEFIAVFYENAITEESPDESAAEDNAEKPEYSRQQREKITLGVSLGILLKQAKPEWADAQFQDAFAMWDAVLFREPARPAGFDGIAEMMMDITASALDDRFRSNRERRLFELTKTLTDWCCTEPFSTENLVAMQARLSQVADTDLRWLLLGVVATGWLQSRNWERASRLAQVVGTDALIKSGFYAKLRSLAKDRTLTADSSNRQKLRLLVLDALLSVPIEASPHAFDDALAGWLSLRTSENIASAASASAGDQYLMGIADWTLKTLNTQNVSAGQQQ